MQSVTDGMPMNLFIQFQDSTGAPGKKINFNVDILIGGAIIKSNI